MIYSEESRMLYGPGFKKPLVATLITGVSEHQLVNRYLDGFTFYHHNLKEGNIRPESMIQLLARIAYRGTLLPPFVAMSHPEVIAPMGLEDQLKIATRLCELNKFPTESNYDKGSAYLRARSIIEQTIGVPHIHLEIQEKKEKDIQFSVDTLTNELSSFELAFAGSPELSNLSLSQLLSASKSVITALGGPSSAVTAASSVVAITDIYAHNFEAAFSVALSGATIAVIFRFSDYIGRVFKAAERELEDNQKHKKLPPNE